jgi:hypothetical protein
MFFEGMPSVFSQYSLNTFPSLLAYSTLTSREEFSLAMITTKVLSLLWGLDGMLISTSANPTLTVFAFVSTLSDFASVLTSTSIGLKFIFKLV